MARAEGAKKKTSRPTKRSKASMTDQAYEAIKEKIITLYFLPNQYLNESAICDLLEMGRTPVHLALQRLQIEGLVDVVPRKGVIIQPDSLSRIVEILDARLVVEPHIAKMAAQNAHSHEIGELTRILDEHAHGHHGGGAIDAFVSCDRAFHTLISEISRSSVLAEFARMLHERSTRSWYLHLWQTLDTAASDRQHRAILGAIAKKDGPGAEEAMREHLEALRERVTHLQHGDPRREAVFAR